MGKLIKITAPVKARVEEIIVDESTRIGAIILEKGDVIEIIPQEKEEPIQPLTRVRKSTFQVNEDIKIQGKKFSKGNKIRISEQENLDDLHRRLKFKGGQN